TSLQRNLISSSNPRAMYFNDETHLAWMPGGKVEIISFDSESGGRFFIEDPPENPGEKIAFTSPNRCFGCHGGAATNFLPGPVARSHFTGEDGRRYGQVKGHDRVSHDVPFKDRWGGYFVTGAPATLEHLGNAFAKRTGSQVFVDRLNHRAKDSLVDHFDPDLLPRPDSSIVPLLIFDHQIEAHNLIMEARYRHRQIGFETEKFGKPTSKTYKDTEKFFDRVARYFLFADEAPLTGHAIMRNPEYEAEFRKNRKQDSKGRSLRDFDLEDRIFRYRLSYMLQTPTFLDSPEGMKNRVYDRLWPILSSDVAPEGFKHFSKAERTAILEILLETQEDLPPSWKSTEFANR
ncbi:MAG: hypothetical protein AAGC68_06470, partial [Verrucomicrobiota bacterium]